MQTEKIILGIDPGTAVMGFGIISIFKNKIKHYEISNYPLFLIYHDFL